MSFIESINTCYWKEIFNVKGRASRSEYWWSVLFWIMAMFVMLLLIDVYNGSMFNVSAVVLLIVFLWMMLAACTEQVRRLHDIGYSGWLCLLVFIPLLGLFILLGASMVKSAPDNRFGPKPLGKKEKALLAEAVRKAQTAPPQVPNYDYLRSLSNHSQ